MKKIEKKGDKRKMAKLRYFKFYYFYKQAFQELNPFAAKKLLLAIIEYSDNGIMPKKLSKKAMKNFESAKRFIDMDSEINRQNGYLGSKKRWKSNYKTNK